jgi:hypothetical protein
MVKQIKENSQTNCPNCREKKPFRYSGWCAKCVYPEHFEEKKKEMEEGFGTSNVYKIKFEKIENE